MATFPQLKTGAVAQYPAVRSVAFQNQILTFLDGTQQRYRDCSAPLHTWDIDLDALDDNEMAALERFLQDNQGSFASFTFTDPWDGTQYSNCSFASDDLAVISWGEMQGKISVKVIENR